MKKFLTLILVIVFSQSIFAQRAAMVRKDNKFGYINENGSWLIEPSYEKASNFSNGMAAVFNGDKWGFIDINNQLVIDYQFDKVKRFDSGIAIAAKDKRWFYIDESGNEITTMPASDKVYDFKNGFALKSGWRLKVSTEKAETFNVIPESLDWIYPA